MRRTPLKPGKGFKRKAPPPRPCKVIDYEPRPRAAAVAVADTRAMMVVQVPKSEPVQHERYMAAVRRLPCARCGVMGQGLIQFCHADTNARSGGKGLGLKSDCRLGWPGCGPRGQEPGCHWFVGTSGTLKKAERREFEEAAGAATRALVRLRGEWPADLAPWPEDEEATA